MNKTLKETSKKAFSSIPSESLIHLVKRTDKKLTKLLMVSATRLIYLNICPSLVMDMFLTTYCKNTQKGSDNGITSL